MIEIKTATGSVLCEVCRSPLVLMHTETGNACHRCGSEYPHKKTRNQDLVIELMNITADVYNKFKELEGLHPSDVNETARDIHNIQNRILANAIDKKLFGVL